MIIEYKNGDINIFIMNINTKNNNDVLHSMKFVGSTDISYNKRERVIFFNYKDEQRFYDIPENYIVRIKSDEIATILKEHVTF